MSPDLGHIDINLFSPGVAAPRQSSRIENIDILRGLALLGMLIEHFQNYPPVRSEQTLNTIVSFVVWGTSYPLFTCLFGIGFALQFERWGDRPDVAWLYVRRLLALGAFALVFTALTGYKVLQLYALWGFALLLVRRWSIRSILILALVSTFAYPCIQLANFQWDNRGLTHEQSNEMYRRERAESAAERAKSAAAAKERSTAEILIRQQGPFYKLMALNLRGQMRWFSPGWILIPELNVLPIFLLGMCVVRLKIIEDPARTRRMWWTVFILSMCLAVAAKWQNYLLPKSPLFQLDPLANQFNFVMRQFVNSVLYLGESLWQGLVYATGLILLITRFPRVQRIVGVLAHPGRMSLTNYVTQVTILELFFAKFWLHLPLTRTWALAGSFMLFGLQVVVSRWWLARFRYGLLEWGWRSLTYARWLPIGYAPSETRPIG